VFLTSPELHYSEQKRLSYIEIFIKACIDDNLDLVTAIPENGVIGFGLAEMAELRRNLYKSLNG